MDCQLATNYLELIANTNWQLLQYRVDMNMEATCVRKSMFYQHQKILPKLIFDDIRMFIATCLSPDDKPMLATCGVRERTKVQTTVKLALEVHASLIGV